MLTPQVATSALLLGLLLSTPACGQTPAESILASYTKLAGVPASAERGKAFFIQKRKGGLYDSCATCHTADPLKPGRDETSERPIPPLAPAVTNKYFSDAGRVDYMFRLNCKDVVGRECSAGEKADIVAWLLSLKP